MKRCFVFLKKLAKQKLNTLIYNTYMHNHKIKDKLSFNRQYKIFIDTHFGFLHMICYSQKC